MNNTEMERTTLGNSFDGDYEHISDAEWANTKEDGGWLLLVCDWGSVHIVPVSDIVLHTVQQGDDCLCVPEVTTGDNGGFVISHSSLDGRELREVTP